MKFSISKKVGLIVSISLAISLSVMLFILFLNESSSQMSSAEEEVKTVQQTLIKSITFAMSQGTTDIHPFIEKMQKTEGFAELRILPTDKITKGSEAKMDAEELKVLSSKKGNSFTEDFNNLPVYRTIEPMLSDESCNSCHSTNTGDPLAVVSLRYSLERMKSDLVGNRWVAILLAIGTMLVTYFSSMYFIKKYTVSQLESLTVAAEKIANGEHDIKLIATTEDEIGSLTKSFNKMLDNVSLLFQYVENIPNPIMAIDREFSIQYMNKAGAKVVGKTQKELVGLKCYDQFKTTHCKTENCALHKAMINNNIFSSETIAKPIDAQLPILYTGAPLKDKEGKVIGAIEAVTPIVEIKELQLYLKNSADEIIYAMDKFSDGDLTVSLIPKKDDDMGKIYVGFNKAVSNVSNLISEVYEAIQATASASNQISSSSEEMAAGAQEQSSQTTEVAGAVDQMTKTILETTRNASSASEAARKAGNIAKEGGKVVEETIMGMNRVSDVVKQSAITVQALGKSSDEIGEIAQVIDDIADQTNLLALNAAIEAARAGEQGRGFAVVADEVRKLAERTAKATKEIASMIKQIQKDTSDAVLSMTSGTLEVEKGKELADKAGQSLREIIKGAEQVVDMSTQVAAASEEQSAAAEEISKNIEAINNVTNESASGIQQIARASEDLSRLTVNLQELISRFKLDNKSNKLVRR